MAVNSALLVAYARAARVHAYCPYSGFPVGAALLASSGEVYCGVNCESASYGATICAERAALTAAVTAGETAFVALAVAAGEEPVPPWKPPCPPSCRTPLPAGISRDRYPKI